MQNQFRCVLSCLSSRAFWAGIGLALIVALLATGQSWKACVDVVGVMLIGLSALHESGSDADQ